MTKYEHAGRMTSRCNHVAESSGVNPWLSLAQGIVWQAMLDWWRLLDGRSVPNEDFESLRQFFRSRWCDNLLLFTEIDPELIVEKLEKQLTEVHT